MFRISRSDIGLTGRKGVFTADASDLGLAPGQWPRVLLLEGVGVRRDTSLLGRAPVEFTIEPSEAREGVVVYRSAPADGGLVLEVYND